MIVSHKKDNAWYMLFTFPLILIFITVVIVPFLIGIGFSFISWDGIAANPKVFVGFSNYLRLFQDERFLLSGWVTVRFSVLVVVLVNILGLLFSLIVTTQLRSRHVARTLFFMPNLIGGLILGYIWKFIFTDTFKFIGGKTGLEQVFFNWLINPDFAIYSLAIVFTWQMAGYTMIIYIAGIQGIPRELMEAAKVDGANLWQRLSKIVFPLLMPAFTICLFLTLSGAFKIFDVNLSLTNGGPINSTELLALNIYNEIFGYGRYGLGQAKAILFFLIVAAVTLTQVIITKKKEVQM